MKTWSRKDLDTDLFMNLLKKLSFVDFDRLKQFEINQSLSKRLTILMDDDNQQ